MSNVQIGDWVRFYRDGRLVIGEVRYLSKDALGNVVANTDMGTVEARYVLESRNARIALGERPQIRIEFIDEPAEGAL